LLARAPSGCEIPSFEIMAVFAVTARSTHHMSMKLPFRTFSPGLVLALACAISAIVPRLALAHGFVGQRFFPATIATDDPFVADELSLPTITSVRNSGSDEGPASRQTTIGIELSKRITQNFGISFGIAHERFSSVGQPAASGYDNAELGLKYQLYRNEAHESLVSAGLVWEIGGSGSTAVGADRFSTYTPTVYFGKGFGGLPAAVHYLRPLAVTGTVAVAIPGQSRTIASSLDPETGMAVSQVHANPHVLQVGLAFQYSIPYLQSAVKDFGLGTPWNRMIPVVEIAASKPIDRVSDRSWTASINPGVLWAGRYVQFGLEAVVPMNRASGHGVGVQAQLHFFMDDLFPHSFGRLLVGN
jgi:hypothetical protein